jgi:hypothetical protein
VWQAIAVALLLVASVEGAAIVALALVIKDLERELKRQRAPPVELNVPPLEELAPPRRPVGFRLEE